MCLVLLVGALCGWYFLANSSSSPEPSRSFSSPAPSRSSSSPVPSELAPIATSRFLNTSPKATYVGSSACTKCHPNEHKFFEGSAHSRSITEIEVETEPPDAQFDDVATGRSYSIYRKGTQLWHRESIPTGEGEELVLADYPMRWAIGSGRFSRSYLVEIDGFLVESPATWFAASRGWALSPGYEKGNLGFQRSTETRCIRCHAGRVETVDSSLHRLKLHAVAIDCERCHGPASLHVERWTPEDKPSGKVDLTIVNPRHLARDQDESICAQCHLNSAATVEIRGRRLDDFRPGLLLNDFQINYGLESPNRPMTVDGHVEQMRLSRCYEASDTLTCTTCHVTHTQLGDKERLLFYRDRCVGCHTEQGCGLNESERLKKDAQNNCVACHMPRVPTQLQHFAFTHHRIGIHTSELPDHSGKEFGVLVPLDDIAHIPKIEQDRCLGLAYNWFSDKLASPEQGALYRERARRILEDVHRRGLQDPELLATLTRLLWLSADRQRSLDLARSVLESENPSPGARHTALFTLGIAYFEAHNFVAATPILERLVRARRSADTWYMLSICREHTGDLNAALKAIQNATAIDPYAPELSFRLAELHRQTGNDGLAMIHETRARQLAKARRTGSK